MTDRRNHRIGSIVAGGLAVLVLGGPPEGPTALAAGSPPTLVEATSLRLRDDVVPPLDLRKRKLSFRAVSRSAPPEGRIVPPARGGADDPTRSGAVLVIENGNGSGERSVVVLPAPGWKTTGSAAKPTGYQYSDRGPGAAVSRASIRGDLIAVSGGGAALAYSLDEASQGRVSVRLQIGSSSWCAVAPARPMGNPASTAKTDLPGRFDGQPRAPAPAACAVAPARFQLTVGNGSGSGLYAPGDTVRVWADVRPWEQLVTGWTGDAALLAEPDEWNTTLEMPARDVGVAATVVDRPLGLATETVFGVTTNAKTLRSRIPAQPRGLVIFLHGTGGNGSFITHEESAYVALRALESGYGVLGPEAEEAVAGDLNGDGKQRWNAALSPGNVDLANLNDLVADLRAAGRIGATTPLFVLGMSNGGSMAVTLGAVGAAAVAGVFPELRFAAAVVHCAEGRVDAVATTLTPTAWLNCAHDDNGEVDNTGAEANSAALAARGVPTSFAAHPATPLFDERFRRVPGVDRTTSIAIAAELRAAGFVGPDGVFSVSTDAITAAVIASPSLFPALLSLPGGARNGVGDQVRVMQAEHQMFSDWAGRAVAFFEAHRP